MTSIKVKTSFLNLQPTWANLLLGGSLFFHLSTAWAQVGAPDTQPAPPSAAVTLAPATTSNEDLKFDLYNDSPKESSAETQRQAQAAQETEHKGRIRRTMLTTHQAFGFSTLAMLAATLVIGQLNYQDKYVSGNYTGRYETAHLGLGVATTAMFATTGVLALFAPSPYAKKYRFDSAMVHRLAMALATAGMVTQIILGPIIDTHAGQLDQPRLALGHLIAGYATFAFMATGTLAYVF